MFLLVFFVSVHQIILSCGESTYSAVQIERVPSGGRLDDRFELPEGYGGSCSSRVCDRFNANLTPSRHYCLCSCSRVLTSTFGVKNGFWSCIGNKEIRDRELDDCGGIFLFDNEKETDPLRMLKTQQSAILNTSANIMCFDNTAIFSYQACDGGWITLTNASTDWGLYVTTANSKSVLKIKDTTQSMELHGNIMRLAMQCSPKKKPLCWLFKIAGHVTCPFKLKNSATNEPPESETTTAIAPGTTATISPTKSTSSEEVSSTAHAHSVSSVHMSHLVPVITSSPAVTVISTDKATNTWPTEGNVETIDEGSHEVPIPLIIGAAGSAVIVLLLAIFIGLLMRRKRKERHKAKRDNPTVQYTSVEDKAHYQSLSPSPDGATQRGVYALRYNVPENDENNPCRSVEGSNKYSDCDEYDYAKSSFVIRNKVLKFSAPLSDEKASNTTDDNGPFYHVLDGDDKGLQNKEPSEGDILQPNEGTPLYQVLEGPNPSEPQDNLNEPESKQAHDDDVPKELDPYYHVLEGSKDDAQKVPNKVAHEEGAYYYALNGPSSSSDSQDGCGYKDIQSDGRIPTDYQALHKYAYVTCGE